jgi:lipopolysaccharide/colanic/teichoic acid biosynthesis glycosyltransferase
VPDEDITARYRDDPRITRVGRVLRRWSIDELPQLIHVVTGRMSLVGPRPLLVDELPLLVDSDHRRHMIKPGLTGLWQVSGRKDVEWDERMRLDLWYVENWSPALDLVIVLRTFRAIVTGHGAY